MDASLPKVTKAGNPMGRPMDVTMPKKLSFTANPRPSSSPVKSGTGNATSAPGRTEGLPPK